jgi:hypothetical protein
VGKAGIVSFELYTGICLTTEEKDGKPLSVQPSGDYPFHRLDLLGVGVVGVAWIGLLIIGSRRLPVGDFSQPSFGTSAFQVAELRSSPHQLILSRNSHSEL